MLVVTLMLECIVLPQRLSDFKRFHMVRSGFPKDVQGIVELTIINKEIIKDLFRGDIEAY